MSKENKQTDGIRADMILSEARQYGEEMHLDLWYPQVENNPVKSFVIGLVDVRAADDIRVSYDFERDGWKIEQASVFSWSEDDEECDPDWQEVTFVQAWGREGSKKKKASLPSRRYTCEVCGDKGRRGNKPEERSRPSICPSCERTKSRCSVLPWVDAVRHPLADVKDARYTIFAGYEDLRLFAIRLRHGKFEYRLGTVDDSGSIIDVDGNDTGRQVWDADFYFRISEPNVIADTPRDQKNMNNQGSTSRLTDSETALRHFGISASVIDWPRCKRGEERWDAFCAKEHPDKTFITPHTDTLEAMADCSSLEFARLASIEVKTSSKYWPNDN